MTSGVKDIRTWEVPLPALDLAETEVQVWQADQDQPPDLMEAFRRTLSVDEMERAGRFRFDRDRFHFTVARGILRQMLGNFLHIAASKVRFHYGEYGKPALSEEFSSSRLKFNISHSDRRVLMAFAIGRELGIDIERIRPDFATDNIAERFFSAFEVERLRSLPSTVRAEAFFNCWTRKEAFIKAIGEGLSYPLDGFDVTLAPGEPAKLLAIGARVPSSDEWAMLNLEACEGYRAAIVIEGKRGNRNAGDTAGAVKI